MKPAPFDYARPASLAEATGLLAQAAGAAQVIAGGQTLMPLLALRMSQPLLLVDIAALPELREVSIGAQTVRIGATLTQNALIAHAGLAQALPLLGTAARHVGHHQTRNRGTVGGSVALGEPAAELPATMVALGTTIELASVRGTRRVAAREFYLGPYATAAEPDELLVAIEIPRWPAAIPVFRELARRPGDFALAGLTGMIAHDGAAITRAGLAWFAMGPTPVAATALEQALVGQRLAALDPAVLAEAALAGTAPFDDGHASAEYRRTVARRLFTRALSEALDLRTAA